MTRPWFKLWTERMLSSDYFMLSERARSTLLHAMLLASKVDGQPMIALELQVLSAIPMAKQELALKELERRGFVVFGDGGFQVPMFAEMQKPTDETAASRIQKWRERNALQEPLHNGEHNDEHNALRNGQEEQKYRDTPTEGKPSVPPSGVSGSSRKRVAPVRLDDAFGDLEPLVVSVLANDAAERQDGKIAESVIDTLRQRLARNRERYGVDAVRHGLEVALDKGKGVAYACGCMKGYTGEDDRLGRAPERQYALLSIYDRNGQGES